jgi:hypothetical protein
MGRSFTRRGLPLVLATLLCLAGTLARAQSPPRPGSLRVVVKDATGLAISAARVIVTPATDSHLETAAARPLESATSDSGTADIAALQPGLYRTVVESPGFETLTIADIRIRSGARTTREVTMSIAGFVEQVEVVPPEADRALSDAFTTDLTSDQIEALPEDPSELSEVLAQLAGTDAEIRVDGFLNGELPPGTEIQNIRIRWDAASAGSSGGGPRVEIRTVPGGDRWRSTLSARFRDESLNARNAFSLERPSGQTRQYSLSLRGPLVKNRTGLSLSVDRSTSLDQQAIRAATPTGLFSALVAQPTERLSVSTRVEHAITPAQRLRVDVRYSTDEAANQGLGEFDVPERAYAREGSRGELRISHNVTLSNDLVHDIRFQTRWRSSESQPRSLATAVRVPGTFSSGGAQTQGGRQSLELSFEDELMLTLRERHQVTTGISVEGGHDRGDEWRNAGGTFTFASLDDLAAGRPTSYTQRLGNPAFSYSMYQVGAFVQDDIRVRRNLVLNLGIRQEVQTHLSDWANFAPRLGVNWTPSARLRTTLRAGFNVSYRGFEGSTYEQTLLVNGERQRELVIESPSYPDPSLEGVEAAERAPGIIRASHGLVMPETRRLSIGVDQPIARAGRIRATYSRRVGRHLFRSIDANAPVDGVRPDPTARNITELESTARSLDQSFELNGSFNYPKLRFSANATYTLGESFDETDGTLTLPPDSFHLEDEWGPSGRDIRHRFRLATNSDLALGFRLGARVQWQSAAPYTITSGFDTNGDGVNNERPAGIGRNTARGAGTRNLDLTLTWSHGMGERAGSPNPRRRGEAPGRPNPFVRFELYLQANNAFNLVNARRFSGVVTSPFFGRPTSASAPRRITVGSRVFF